MECIDIIISINVYKSVTLLKYQLQNIYENVLCKYYIVINCDNINIFNELNNIDLPKNIHINPEIIKKERFTGTITKGIISNMYYSINNFNFKYFLILSGRTVFYKKIGLENLDKKKIYMKI